MPGATPCSRKTATLATISAVVTGGMAWRWGHNDRRSMVNGAIVLCQNIIYALWSSASYDDGIIPLCSEDSSNGFSASVDLCRGAGYRHRAARGGFGNAGRLSTVSHRQCLEHRDRHAAGRRQLERVRGYHRRDQDRASRLWNCL